MAKQLACALTHARHEGFFLEKWIAHYSAIVGRDNLFVTLDGDDWQPQVDLTGIQVDVITDAPRRRIQNDRFIAKAMSGRANALRKRYRYVLRTDADEFVCLDPAAGLDWEQALAEVDEAGYVFALGVDVIQRGDGLPAADRRQPMLAQRPHGLVASLYSKPFVIARWNNWAGGAHRLINRPVRISGHFRLFHLALADLALATERHAARGGGGQHGSHLDYQNERFAMIRDSAALAPLPFDVVTAVASHGFAQAEDGSPATRPRPVTMPDGQPLYTTVPARFHALV